jgi:hypothetical protein
VRKILRPILLSLCVFSSFTAYSAEKEVQKPGPFALFQGPDRTAALKFDIIGPLLGTIQVEGELKLLNFLSLVLHVSYSNSSFDVARHLFWAESFQAQLGAKFVLGKALHHGVFLTPQMGVLVAYPFQRDVNAAGIRKTPFAIAAPTIRIGYNWVSPEGLMLEMSGGFSLYAFYMPYGDFVLNIGWAF